MLWWPRSERVLGVYAVAAVGRPAGSSWSQSPSFLLPSSRSSSSSPCVVDTPPGGDTRYRKRKWRHRRRRGASTGRAGVSCVLITVTTRIEYFSRFWQVFTFLTFQRKFLYVFIMTFSSSVLWRCWLGGRKGIRPVKNWVVGCWHVYLSGAMCRFAYGPADATATHCLLLL